MHYKVKVKVDSHGAGLRCAVLAGALFGLSPVLAGPISIIECQGADGKVFFSDRCPPGSKPLRTKEVRTGGGDTFDVNRLKQQHPVVMYLVDVCDACDLMQNYLDKRGVPYTKKNVSADNPENQDELKEKAGQLTVPVVTVGETVVNGYNRAALAGALDAAGYPDAQVQGGSTGETGQATP